MTIDWTRMLGAEDRQAQEAADRAAAARAECRRRILAVANETAQMNLAAAAAAGLLTAEETRIYALGVGWVAAMRAACAGAAAAADPGGDSLWPPIPEGVKALSARF